MGLVRLSQLHSNLDEKVIYMANMEVDFCGLKFKNPMVVASLEPANSPNLLKQCFDNGAGGRL